MTVLTSWNHLLKPIKGIRNVRNCFVPSFKECSKNDLKFIQSFIDQSQKLLVLTGAGISTESGIPDYRSKDIGLYNRLGYRPMNYSDFLDKPHLRQRYWTRSFFGWKYMYERKPNINHLTLTKWQRAGKLFSCVTQNVDRLHHKAGTESVIELHGNLFNVHCIKCDYRILRTLFQKVLSEMNKDLLLDEVIQTKISSNKVLRPDGDVDVDEEFMQSFRVPSCPRCTGILKPEIVFFGGNVASNVVQDIYDKVMLSDSLLVLGSSLEVYSSYRFVLAAHQGRKQIAIINIGQTRADPLSGILKIDSKLSDILPKIQM